MGILGIIVKLSILAEIHKSEIAFAELETL